MNNLSSLPSILKRRAIPAAITVLCAIALGVIHGLFSKPIYEASTRLIVGAQTVSLSEIGQDINESRRNIPTGATLLATQSELIKSERVLAGALASLSPEFAELGVLEEPLTIEAIKENLTVSIIPATNILELTFVHADPAVAAAVLNQVAEAVVAEGAESIRAQAASARRFLEEKIPEQRSKLLEIEAAETLYRQETGIVSLDVQTQNWIESLTQVRAQELSLATQLQEAQVRDDALRNVTGVNSLERAYSSVRVGQNETINQLEAQLVEIESVVAETESLIGPRHPDMVELLARRDKLRNFYQQTVAGLIPGSAVASPASQGAAEEISQDLISQYILGQIERNALAETLSTVQSEREQLEGNLSRVPEYQQPLFALVRDREEAASTLSLLRNKLEEARIAEAQVTDIIRISDSAQVPTEPSSSGLVSLAVSGFAGLLLAVGVVLLLETIDDRLHTVEELEAAVDLPVLGLLPKGLPADFGPGSMREFLQNNQWTEAYRLLFKALVASSYQSVHQNGNQNDSKNDSKNSSRTPALKPDVFVLSGLRDQEGQTLAVANLAAVASWLSQKTLIIDANVQQPFQHLFFDVSSQPGLSNLLENRTLSDPHAILKSAQISPILNVNVLPYSGSVGEANGNDYGNDLGKNVSENPRMRALLAAASEQYDFTVVAAPAVADCADAATLSSYGAGLVLVVQANVTTKSLLKQSLKKLSQSGTPVIGLVMAQTLDDREPDYSLSYPYEQAANHTAFPVSLLPRRKSSQGKVYTE